MFKPLINQSETCFFTDVTWRHLPPAAVWQTVEGCAGRGRSPPSAPGSEGGSHQWWETGTFGTWRPQTLQHTKKHGITALNHSDAASNPGFTVNKLSQSHRKLIFLKTHSPAFSRGSLHRDEDLDLMPIDSVRLSSTGRTIWQKQRQSQPCLPRESSIFLHHWSVVTTVQPETDWGQRYSAKTTTTLG